jgi:hypothetical protein
VSVFDHDFTQDFLTSRRNFPDGNTRIGETGRLWYDSITNTIRISDGVTPGGIIVSGGGSGPGASGYSGFSGFSGETGFFNPWFRITTSYTAQNNDRIIADTSGGTFTITLPADPVLGYYVQITDGGNFATNNCIVDPNGNTVEHINDVVLLDLARVTFEFIFDGATWQVTGTTGSKGPGGDSGFSGLPGQAGDSGYSGYSGFSGSTGSDGASGLSGISGWSGRSGFSGSGVSGFSGFSGFSGLGLSGYSGVSGYSGLSGEAGDNNLIWTASGIYRTLTAFKDPDDNVTTVRSAEFSNNLLRLTLASFTPTLNALASPATNLNWDVAATGFTVLVTNPDDILIQYVNDVQSLTVLTGSISDLSLFTAGAKSATPAPTIDWNQPFTTNAGSFIRPVSTTITGGTASAQVNFTFWNGSATVAYTGGTATFTVTWATPTLTVTLSSLTGNTFLQSYNSVNYTVTVTGITTSSNYANTVTATGGSVSNPVGSGVFTFTDPINKNTTATARTVSTTTVFTRPVAVTGTSYTASLTSTTANPSATFTYPSLWVFTPSTFDVPVRSTFVNGTGFQSAVTVLANQVKVFNAYVNNTLAVPQGFWFAIRSSASQPTVFKTGASPSLLSDVAVTTGNSVSLEPDSPPAGYVAENYTLYGITLQPGSTYVSIS